MNIIDIPALNEKLIESADIGDLNGVKYWLSNGADVCTKNYLSLRHASRNGHIEVVKLLLDHADDHADNDWSLKLADSNCHTKIVKLFHGCKFGVALK